MSDALRYIVFVLLIGRFVVGAVMVPITLMALVGLAGLADPTSSSSFLFRLLIVEVPVDIASAPLAWYVMTRDKDKPRLFGLILVVFGVSLIPVWTRFLENYSVVVWGFIIAICACGALATLYPGCLATRRGCR